MMTRSVRRRGEGIAIMLPYIHFTLLTMVVVILVSNNNIRTFRKKFQLNRNQVVQLLVTVGWCNLGVMFANQVCILLE